jgi:hypothetical protein
MLAVATFASDFRHQLGISLCCLFLGYFFGTDNAKHDWIGRRLQ